MLRRATAEGSSNGAAGVAIVALAAALAGGSCSGGSAPTRAEPPPTATIARGDAATRSAAIPRPFAKRRTTRRPRVRHRSYDGPVTAIGDSVMLDAAPVLRARLPAIDVDASTDRAVETGITALRTKVTQGERRGPIVFHLGNNSSFSRSQVATILQIAAGRRVVLVTDHCAYCSWVPGDNVVIHAFCTRSVRCFVADWAALANAHAAWFGTDGVHMPIGGAGARAYTQLVLDAIYAR
jgi:hypothetical protein